MGKLSQFTQREYRNKTIFLNQTKIYKSGIVTVKSKSNNYGLYYCSGPGGISIYKDAV